MAISLQTKDIRLPVAQSWAEDFAQFCLTRLGVAGHNLNILFIGDEEMTWFNKNYRDKEGPTNVLSFPFAEGADDFIENLPVHELGDIVISVDTAIREAIEYGQAPEYRLNWLIIHGILHLMGYDHERGEKDAKEMEIKEQEFLQSYVRRRKMAHLAINVDHVATIRQARGINSPDPVAAAAICEMAGASGIVVHLREDRRHIQDRDALLIRETIKTKLNFEMGANKEIVKFALNLMPDLVTLVPEKRAELTTEGGLDVAGQMKKLGKTVEKFAAKDIPVAFFVDPTSEQLVASRDLGATFVELHTGRYCDATTEAERNHELQLIIAAAEEASQLGLRVNAGHGLDFHNTAPIAAIDAIEELSIGHAIIGRAVFSGLDQAVRDMLHIVQQASK